MKKKSLLIITGIIITAAIACALAVYLVNRGMQAGEDDAFVPSVGGKADVSNLKEAKITIYMEGRSNAVMPDVLAAVNGKLHAELKTKLALEMIWEYPEQYLAKIKADIAAGKPCDAFFYSSSNFPESFRQLAKEGLIKDLTEDLTTYAPDYISQFSNDERKAMCTDGKNYAIPYRIPTAQRKCVMVRDDLMEKYKIPEIKNYEDFEVYLDTVKKNEPDLIPLDYWDTTLGLFSEVNGYAVLDYDIGLVYKWNDPAIKVMAWEQTPEFVEGIHKIKEWYDKEYLTKNVGITSIDNNIISSGKWASFISNWGDEFGYNSILASAGIKDYKFKAYPLNDGISPRNSPLESSLVINAKSEQSDRVLMFINWLQSKPENYDLLMYGVKGRNYIDRGDYIVPADVESEQNSFFNWGWRVPFRNIAYERANFPGLNEKVENYNKGIEEKTKYPPAVGFLPDYSSVQEIVALRKIDYSNMDKMVYNGTFVENDIEDIIKEQKDNGVQRLVDEIQRQLDEFKQAGN